MQALIPVGQQSYSQEYYDQVEAAIAFAGDSLPDEERLLMQCPPRYTQFQAPEEGMRAYYDFSVYANLAQDIERTHSKQRVMHVNTLHQVYKVFTRLQGITAHHNPNGLIQDSKLLGRRLVLTEAVERRLQEITERDRVYVGMKFCGENNPQDIYTVYNIEKLSPQYPNSTENVYWKVPGYGTNYRSLSLVKELLSIGIRRWRQVV